jgi:hypothetical protein
LNPDSQRPVALVLVAWVRGSGRLAAHYKAGPTFNPGVLLGRDGNQTAAQNTY